MQCSEVHTRLATAAGDDELQRHLAECPACATLAEDAPLRQALESERVPTPPDLGEVWSRTHAAVQREAHWSRSLSHLPTGQRIALVLLTTLGVIAWMLWVRPRPNLDAYASDELALLVGGSALVLGAGAWLGYRPIYRPALPPVLPLVVAVLALMLAWVPVWLPGVTSGPALGDMFARRTVGCFAYGAAVALAQLGLLILIARGERRISRIPASVFMAAGLVGTVALHLHCPAGDPAHIAIGHSSVLTLLLILPLVARLRADGTSEK